MKQMLWRWTEEPRSWKLSFELSIKIGTKAVSIPLPLKGGEPSWQMGLSPGAHMPPAPAGHIHCAGARGQRAGWEC